MPSRGFSYAGTPPADIRDLDRLSDEWLRLAALFERLKSGAWEAGQPLQELVSSSGDDEIRYAGLRLIGHTATRAGRHAIGEFFSHPFQDTRLAAYEAAQYACDLQLVEPLLLASRGSKMDERLAIMSSLSHLLEAEPDRLYDDSNGLSQDQYEYLVRSVRRDCESRYGVDTAILEGRPLSLAYIMQRIEVLCDGGEAYEFSGTISMYFDLFEALTGRPTIGVFDREVAVDPHAAINVLAEFQRSGGLARFERGQRYFFGRRLPS